MSQIQRLLNNLYGDKDVVKHRFIRTLERLKLYKRGGFTKRPRRPGPKR